MLRNKLRKPQVDEGATASALQEPLSKHRVWPKPCAKHFARCPIRWNQYVGRNAITLQVRESRYGPVMFLATLSAKGGLATGQDFSGFRWRYIWPGNKFSLGYKRGFSTQEKVPGCIL